MTTKRQFKRDVFDAIHASAAALHKVGAIDKATMREFDAHGAWFGAKVQEALNDPRPAIAGDEVEAHFALRRAAALRKQAEPES